MSELRTKKDRKQTIKNMKDPEESKIPRWGSEKHSHFWYTLIKSIVGLLLFPLGLLSTMIMISHFVSPYRYPMHLFLEDFFGHEPLQHEYLIWGWVIGMLQPFIANYIASKVTPHMGFRKAVIVDINNNSALSLLQHLYFRLQPWFYTPLCLLNLIKVIYKYIMARREQKRWIKYYSGDFHSYIDEYEDLSILPSTRKEGCVDDMKLRTIVKFTVYVCGAVAMGWNYVENPRWSILGNIVIAIVIIGGIYSILHDLWATRS